MRFKAALLALAFVAIPSALLRAETPSAADLAARIQAHYATVHDFVAAFTLRETSALLTDPAEDRGDVKIKKPGRMRWSWSTGGKELVVSDGTQIYSYFPRDKYVTIVKMPTGNQASTGLLFLTGQGNLTRDFIPALSADQPADEWHLDVKPKAAQADFSRLTIEVDRRSLQLRGLVVYDNQGGTQTFRFSNMRENQNLSDHDFEFTPPKNVEIRQ